ncbi:MAG: flagellar basal body rod protein FlgB [Anaerolineales bacterium]|nr:flagellar basal body rod protein FlgB [Anaerolineales bacterium]
MSGSILPDNAIRTAASALNGLARRQEMTAQNIANIDTPGYRAQEVDFETALRQAAGSERHLSVQSTHGNHLASQSTPVGYQIETRKGGTERADGNNVDIDLELATMAETGVRYQALTSLISRKLSLLKNIANRS